VLPQEDHRPRGIQVKEQREHARELGLELVDPGMARLELREHLEDQVRTHGQLHGLASSHVRAQRVMMDGVVGIPAIAVRDPDRLGRIAERTPPDGPVLTIGRDERVVGEAHRARTADLFREAFLDAGQEHLGVVVACKHRDFVTGAGGIARERLDHGGGPRPAEDLVETVDGPASVEARVSGALEEVEGVAREDQLRQRVIAGEAIEQGRQGHVLAKRGEGGTRAEVEVREHPCARSSSRSFRG
jgi:hypothetical protein